MTEVCPRCGVSGADDSCWHEFHGEPRADRLRRVQAENREFVRDLQKAIASWVDRGTVERSPKLIRDYVQVSEEEIGPQVFGEAYLALLNEKLFEELEELWRAETPERIAEETADVMDVLFARAAALDVNRWRIRDALEAKRQSSGGFLSGRVWNGPRSEGG